MREINENRFAINIGHTYPLIWQYVVSASLYRSLLPKTNPTIDYQWLLAPVVDIHLKCSHQIKSMKPIHKYAQRLQMKIN